MADIGTKLTAFLLQRLQSSIGLNSVLKDLRALNKHAPQDILLFTARNITAELMEKSNQALYPNVLVYCEKLSNKLTEKFRVFSGSARLTVELRTSEDRLEALDSTLIYTDIVCGVLTALRGEWFAGAFYDGEYEVSYSPVRPGGKHFLQSSKVTFEVDVSA